MEKTATRAPVLVGVDDGYAMTKIAMEDGRLLKIPSKARSGVHGVSAFGKTAGLDGGYETEGQSYTVDDHLEGEGTRFDEYPFSALNRVVVHHALRTAGLGGKQVRIATGLPVSHYFSGSMINLSTTERKSANLSVPVKTLSGNPCAEIVSNAVYAEGVAAWVDFAVDSSGTVKANLGRTAAVVDIGGRTTDCVTVLPGWKVDHGRSGTQNVGVLNLYEAVENRIRARFGVPDVPMELIEVAVRTGMVSLWGRDEDVSEIIASSKKEVFDQILREVYRRIGRGHDMEKVLFVGGGAVVFDGLQRSFPNAHTPENPEFANARGLLKCMQFGG